MTTNVIAEAITAQSEAGERLQSFVSRIEKMEEEKAAIVADVRETYKEAKSNGFDTKVLRKLIARRKRDQQELREEEELLELYLTAIGDR